MTRVRFAATPGMLRFYRAIAIIVAVTVVLVAVAVAVATAAPIQTETHCSPIGDVGRVCSAIRYRMRAGEPRVRSIRACLSGADYADPAADRGRMWVTTKWGRIVWRRDGITYPNDGGAICVRRWVGGVDAGRAPRVLVSGRALLADGTRVGWAQWTALP